MKKLLFLIFTLFLIPSVGWAGYTSCGTNCYLADSASSADVDSAIDAAMAASGGEVRIPAGTVSWIGQLSNTISKNLKITGAGQTSTVITVDTSDAIIFTISDGISFELSQFKLVAASAAFGSGMLSIVGTTAVTDVNVHHITFDSTNLLSGRSLRWGGNGGHPYGVIHSCTFNGQSAGQVITVWGSIASPWPHGNPDFGSANFVFIEDNTFNNAATGDGAFDSVGGNGRLVWRYNTVNDTCIGWHGYESNTWSTHAVEVYNNVFTSSSSQPFSINNRGGTMVAHNNTYSSNYPSTFTLTYYRSCDIYKSAMCPGAQDESADASGYHCYQQPGTTGTNGITHWPTIEWDNNYAGGSNNMGFGLNANFTGSNCDAYQTADGNPTTYDMTDHVKEERDFLNHDTCSDSVDNDGDGDTDMADSDCSTFWDSVNSKAATYTPYTYPHPLRGETPTSGHGITITGGSIK